MNFSAFFGGRTAAQVVSKEAPPSGVPEEDDLLSTLESEAPAPESHDITLKWAREAGLTEDQVAAVFGSDQITGDSLPLV